MPANGTLADRYKAKREELIDVLASNLEPQSPIDISYVAIRLKELGEDFDRIAEDARVEGLEGKVSSHHSYSGR